MIQQRIKKLIAAVGKWEDLSYKEQVAYLKSHPTSKKRRTQPSPDELAEHLAIIKQTFLQYHKSQRGKVVPDFIGRPEVWGDEQHHRRGNFYIWRANIYRALKNNHKVPANVLADYRYREKLYQHGGATAAYELKNKPGVN
jgi:hypothetical protein